MPQFRLFRGKSGCFFVEDITTKKQSSLRTRDADEAKRLLAAKNEAHQQPLICLQMARAYLTAADPMMVQRTWETVMDTMGQAKRGPTEKRWTTACKDRAFDLIRDLKLTETRAEQFWKVLNMGTVSTNTFLRRIHNFAVDMNWILAPIIPRRQWPKIHFKEKRAITLEEHLRIVEREHNPERKKFYELAWHLGASQSDLAHLHAEDIDWPSRTITFERMKLRHRAVAPPQIRFGKEAEAIFAQLSRTGPLFPYPYLRTVRKADRATEFKQRYRGLSISGVTLHSYRYAWAERAKTCGYPERFAQMALGHNSKAVPLIVRTVAEYVKVTGDVTILDERAGLGGTVWEKIKCYMRVAFEHRDVNRDGLVEWCNLWEGGADDKVGCFFNEAPLEKWIKAVTTFTDTELQEFYEKKSRPVVNLYEQAFFLHALMGLEGLALLRRDEGVALEARIRFNHIKHVLETRHWNDVDGFYYDWDVKADCQTQTMNQNAFYLLHFLKEPHRARRVT